MNCLLHVGICLRLKDSFRVSARIALVASLLLGVISPALANLNLEPDFSAVELDAQINDERVYWRNYSLMRPLRRLSGKRLKTSVDGEMLKLNGNKGRQAIMTRFSLADLINEADIMAMKVNLDLNIKSGTSDNMTLRVVVAEETATIDLEQGRQMVSVDLTPSQVQAIQVQLAAVEVRTDLTIESPRNDTVEVTLYADNTKLLHLGKRSHLAIAGRHLARLNFPGGKTSYFDAPITVDSLHLNQAVQDIPGTVPTVADRPGLLRLLAVASNNRVNNVLITAVINYADGTQISKPMSGPATMPRRYNPRGRASSYNVRLDRDEVRDNMRVHVEMQMTVAGQQKFLRYPVSGEQALVTTTLPKITLKQIPIDNAKTGAKPKLTTDPFASGYGSTKNYLMHPFPDYQLDIVESLRATTESLKTITGRTDFKRFMRYGRLSGLASKPDHVFVGVLLPGGGGVATVGGRVFVSGAGTGIAYAHEFGHNLKMGHLKGAETCPLRGSVAYHVTADKLVDEFRPGTWHASLMGPCHPTYSQYWPAEGSGLTNRARWASVGSFSRTILLFRSDNPKSPGYQRDAESDPVQDDDTAMEENEAEMSE